MTISITKEMRTETAHRLVNYDGRCAHLHGHSYLWRVTATAPALDRRGMVADFKDLKRVMNEILDPLDHALVLGERDPVLPVLRNVPASNGQAPRLIVLPFNPTAENFAQWAASNIQLLLDPHLNPSVTITEVTVWETATSFATWQRDTAVRSQT